MRECGGCNTVKNLSTAEPPRCSTCYTREREQTDPDFKQRRRSFTKRFRDSFSINPYMYRASKASAKKRGIEWNLSKEDFDRIVDRANGKCELTGIPFSTGKVKDDARRFPYKASLDRIDSERGYVFDNLRLVCNAVNIALNDFGDKVFQEIVHSFNAKKDSEFDWTEVCIYL